MLELKSENKISNGLFDSLSANLSSLVGHNIDIISEQFHGKPLSCRVVLVNENVLSIDRSSDAGQLNNLINNQDIIVQFNFNNQRISVNATFYRTMRNRCNIKLGNKCVPLLRRKYLRYKKQYQIKCASMSTLSINPSRISRLRWLETETVNISSGGVLLRLPANLNKESYMLINLQAQEFGFPNLLIGQVRHSTPTEKFNYNIGVEFIIAEKKEKHFPLLTIKRLPSNAFVYTAVKRAEVEKKLLARMQNIKGDE